LQTAVYTLDQQGNARVEITQAANGSEQAAWRELKDLRKDELDKYFNRAVRSRHANASLNNYFLENLSDMTRDIKMRYSYRIDAYASKAGEKHMIFKLPAAQFSSEETAQPERDLPLYWALPEKTVQQTNFIIPDGWKVEHLPADFSAQGPGHSYQASYEVKGRSIRLQEEYVRTARLLPAQDYAAFKKFREELALFGEDWVVISR